MDCDNQAMERGVEGDDMYDSCLTVEEMKEMNPDIFTLEGMVKQAVGLLYGFIEQHESWTDNQYLDAKADYSISFARYVRDYLSKTLSGKRKFMVVLDPDDEEWKSEMLGRCV